MSRSEHPRRGASCALALLVPFALALPPVQADSITDGEPLEPVVVTGTRLEQPLSEVGSSIHVITAEDLEAGGFRFVLEALAAAPGVTVNQNGAFGGVAAVRIRGAASAQTLVLVDGVVVNDPTAPSGGFDFARLDVSTVERIEILKGPQSTLWGTDAIGGVVSITTRRPAAGTGGELFVEGGSFGTARGGAALTAAGARGDLRVAVTSARSDGLSKADEAAGNGEEDGYVADTLTLRAGLALAPGARLDASLLATRADTDFDGFVFGAPGNVGDAPERSETEELAANLAVRFLAFGGRLQNLVMVGRSEIERQNFSGGVPGFAAEGERSSFRYQGDLEVTAGHHVTFGAERDELESGDGDTTIDGLFGLWEFQPVDGLTVVGGLRRDDHERYGAETTGRVALAWSPAERVTLRGSWGEGFKAPTIFQTTFFCCGAEAPNDALRPETSRGWDVGIDYRTTDGRGRVGFTWFDQETEDLIDFSFALGGFENIALARSEGAELSVGYALTDWLDLAVDYAHIEAVDGDGNPLARVPRNAGDLALRFTPAGPLSGQLLVRYNGAEQDPGGHVPSWTRVDLSARYAWSERIELFGRLENLLDESYQQVLGYGTPDRSGNVGIRVRF